MRAIGNSDLRVHPLALGGNTFGWTADKAASFEVLDAFVAAGGNHVDTADSYSAWVPGHTGGESETILGEWMRARKNRGSVIVATKVAGHPRFKGLSKIVEAAEASLSRLQTDYIDLYYAHHDDPSVPLEEASAAFDSLVRSGRVRRVGLSNFSPQRIREWMQVARENGHALPVALQPHYSLVARAYEKDYAPLAEEFGLGVFPYFALASGFLTGKYRAGEDTVGQARGGWVSKYLNPQGMAVLEALDEVAATHGVSPSSVALAWLLAKPSVVAPLASVSRLSQLGALLDSVKLELGEEEVARLDEVSQPFA